MTEILEYSLGLSESAQNRLGVLLAKKAPGTRFRISVYGGGCSGFQYKFEFSEEFNQSEDVVFPHGNVELISDKISLGLINNSVLDYVENLGGAYFELGNPSAKSSCGCGNSFTT